MAVVDSESNWQAIAIVAASVRERGILHALNNGKVEWPSLRVAILDGAFTAERCCEWLNLQGMGHEVVVRPHGQQGFAVLPGGGWSSVASAGSPIVMVCCVTAPVASTPQHTASRLIPIAAR